MFLKLYNNDNVFEAIFNIFYFRMHIGGIQYD